MPVLRRGIDKRSMQNLRFLGSFPGRHVIKATIPYERYESRYTQDYGTEARLKLKEIAKDEFFMVQPTKENTEFTIKSFDARPPLKYETDKHFVFFSRAQTYLDREYGSIMENPRATDEELYSYIDYRKSGGFPSNFFNINSKRELIEDLGYRKFVIEHGGYYIPEKVYWTTSPKREPKKLSEILDNKIRMFQIPPFELLRAQLKFGKRISLRLKEYKWSAYGFNPYNGGANRLGEQLDRKPYRFFYDVSGWDKFLPLLPDLYKIIHQRSGCENWPLEDQKEFEWSIENTISHMLKMPDGTVYMKDYGNPSGSGCTTRDNILAHVLIIAFAMNKAYFEKNGDFPTQDQVSDQVVKLFGDDSVIAVDEDFSHMCDEKFMEDVFSIFGMKMKFFFGGFEYPVTSMQFLGFTFKKKDNYYYPEYDVVRLASSMLYEDKEPLSRSAHISKAFILTMMSYPTDHFELFNEAYTKLLQSLHGNTRDETERAYMTMGPISDSVARSIYLGFEAMNSVSVWAHAWFFQALKESELFDDETLDGVETPLLDLERHFDNGSPVGFLPFG